MEWLKWVHYNTRERAFHHEGHEEHEVKRVAEDSLRSEETVTIHQDQKKGERHKAKG
jgi:hypothetical protein